MCLEIWGRRLGWGGWGGGAVIINTDPINDR